MKKLSGSGVAQAPRRLAMSTLVIVALFMGAGLDRALIQVTEAADRLTRADGFEIVEETYESIRENYVLQEEVTDEQLMYGAARGMVESLGDTNHSVFLDPDEAEAFMQSSRGELIGIGVTVNTEGELPIVVSPMQDSPAFEAGIRPGDTVLEVDGTDCSTITPMECVDLIRGEEGTDVAIVLQHEGESEPYEVEITRKKIDINPVSWAMLPNNVLWLRLDQFSAGATDGIREAIRQGEELGMTGLILDLRGNPGGLVFEAMGVASQFLPDGTPLYQEMDASGDKTVVDTVGNRGVYLEGDMVVLIDNGSASAAEIVSSALMESDRAELVGQTTFGTGTVLLPFELSDGSMAVLGIELWLTGEGNQIYGEGVDPTIEVPGTIEQLHSPFIETAGGEPALDDAAFTDLDDPQLHAAYEELTGTP